MNYKIAIINAFYPSYEIEKAVLSKFNVEIEHYEIKDLESLIEVTQDVDAILTRETVLPRSLIEKLKNCKVIVRYGVGVDNIDLEAAKEKKIYVCNVKDYGTDSVAEHTLGLLMSISRRIVTRDPDVRKGNWSIGTEEKIYSLKGKILGVVGYGNIGQAFVKKCSGLEFSKVLIYDPWFKNETNFELTNIENLFKKSDVISLHLPLNEKTKYIVNKELISQMKSNAIIINTSRGGLIDEFSLSDALINEKIFGAALDVFEKEPPLKSNPLLSLKNVILTNHIGWYSEESISSLQKKAAEEVLRIFEGKKPISWVNPW
jgi:D-3-phosphoglycerate dehydrogenase